METAMMSPIDKKLVIALVAWVSVLMLVANVAYLVTNRSDVVTSRNSSEQVELTHR